MIKTKKQMYIVIGAFALVLTLFTTTYAFFNYTRTGTANTIRVGRIAFNSSQDGSINLSNVFPIDSEQAQTDTTNAKSVSITVTGDTDYTGGVEYLVSASDVNMTVNGKQLPVTLEIDVEGNNSKTLGTEETGNYYTNRENYQASKYKIEYKGIINEGAHLLVGYIAPNTTSGTIEGIGGVITIKAYIDKDKILISDTYDSTESDNMGTPNSMAEGKTVFTTAEWNSIQGSPLSFKVKVEANQGIWVDNPSFLHQVIAMKSSVASYILNYDEIMESNPSYSTQDQETDNALKKTVYYYTGEDAAANANVLFAGYCWQIVRTTDNGGVKLIYNGVAVDNKCETTREAISGVNSSSLGLTMDLSSPGLFGRSYDYDLNTGEFTIENSTNLPTLWTLEDRNENGIRDYKELIGTYTCLSNSDTCTTMYYVGSINSNNQSEAYVSAYTIGTIPYVSHYSSVGTSSFNANTGCLASVGYMFNKEYCGIGGLKSGTYYTSATWDPSNGEYVLSGGNGGTTPDANHRYICDNYCNEVRYYYYINGTYFYVLLKDGATINDAIYIMTGNKNAVPSEETSSEVSSEESSEVTNDNNNLNKYNSAIKGYLENWYKKNLVAYTSFIDQTTIYCNNRSIRNLGGWNPIGTAPTQPEDLNLTFYSTWQSNVDLICSNETDRFSVSNSNAKLEYPVGLLTNPEYNLMTYKYAKTGENYWMATPDHFGINIAYVSYVSETGSNVWVQSNYDYGVRPVITLKHATLLENGSGTYTDPYVVGPIVSRGN